MRGRPVSDGRTWQRCDDRANMGIRSFCDPLPDLPPQRTSTVVYGASAVDDRGRVADRVVLRALGWPAGHRLDIRESAGSLTIVGRLDRGAS